MTVPMLTDEEWDEVRPPFAGGHEACEGATS